MSGESTDILIGKLDQLIDILKVGLLSGPLGQSDYTNISDSIQKLTDAVDKVSSAVAYRG